MKQTKTFRYSTLILAGASIAGLSEIGSVYTPVEKSRPTREFITSTYISKFTRKGEVVEGLDFKKSEERKKILADIRKIKNEIRLTQEQLDAADKIVDFSIGEFTKQSKQRVEKLIVNRAKELRVDTKYIKADQLARRKGVMLIKEFEIA